MAELVLRAVSRTQGNNEDLKSGTVSPRSCRLAFEEVPVLVQAFRRMVRDVEFDLCEMAATTYLCAKAHHKAFTALPVFLVRAFHHGAIAVMRGGGIEHPRQLEGRRVGVSRGYTVTTGVWARAILEEEHGVDLARVTWVRSGDEHVAEYRPPGNVVAMPEGASLEGLLLGGDLAAVVGTGIDREDVVPLIEHPEEAAEAALATRGFYPINHLVVVRDELLAAHPDLAVDLFEAFAESKARYLGRLSAGAIAEPTPTDRLHQKVTELTGSDPLPYGIAPNRPVLEALIGHAVSQKILDRRVEVGQLFPESTLELVG